jgi:SAM-dependent methyltransferase
MRTRLAPPGTRRERAVQPLVSPVKRLLRLSEEDLHDTRSRLSAQFIHGQGIEIGALHNPLPVPSAEGVLYVDRVPLEQLRREYPELEGAPLVAPTVIDDGEVLSSIMDRSLDFVIANHFIEHCQSPISTLQTHLRVLKGGGILFMAVPDKRFTFDQDRPVTSLEHVVRDFEEGPEWSLRSHAEEWVDLVEHGPSERVEALVQGERSIHFHVWTPTTFLQMLDYCRGVLAFPFALEVFEPNGHEFLVILRRTR